MTTFDDQLDAAANRMLTGQDLPESDDLRDLLTPVQTLMAAPVPAPSQRTARVRMNKALDARRSGAGLFGLAWLGGLTWPRPRQWAPALGVIAVALMILFSSFALPGQWLYPVKQGSEAVRLLFIRTPQGQANYYVKLADRRLSEMERLTATGRPVPAQTMTQYQQAWQRAVDIPGADPSRLLKPAEEQAKRLQVLMPNLPPDLQNDAQSMLDKLAQWGGIDTLPAPEQTPGPATVTPSLTPTPPPGVTPTPATPAPPPQPGLPPVTEPATSTPGTMPTQTPPSGMTPAPPTSGPSQTPPSTPAPTETPDGAISPTPAGTPTFGPSPSPSPTMSVTPTPTITETPEPTETPEETETPGPAETPSHTPSPTFTATPFPSRTPTPRPSHTPSPTHTPAPTHTPRPTRTPAPSVTPTPSRTHTPDPTHTPEPTQTPEPTESPEPTHTPGFGPTSTPSRTHTPEPTESPEPTHTPEPSETPEHAGPSPDTVTYCCGFG